MSDLERLLAGFFTGIGVFGALAVYFLFFPEKVEVIAGWIFGLVGRCARCVDRTAIAYKVQGDVNTLRAEMQKDAPHLLERKLRVKWANVEEAESELRDGQVLVVMRPSQNRDENLAHAVMAYLPKALLCRARPYLDKERMHAADLVVAKALFARHQSGAGMLEMFFERHLGPARAESVTLREKIAELDGLDLEGWLTRVLLWEYQMLGLQLYPGAPDERCIEESEHLATWLYRLSTRRPGDDSAELTFRSRCFNVAIIFVARKELVEKHGLAPYRKRAKRYIYQEKFDSVYLMGRDMTIPSVQRVGAGLKNDALVAEVAEYIYPLRRDFKKRRLNRERAIVLCLRRRQEYDGIETPSRDIISVESSM
jgi:hypothetical protein